MWRVTKDATSQKKQVWEVTVLIQLIISGLLIGGVYALISIGLTLIFGVMRIVNFAHGEFVMLAMFISYWIVTLFGISPYWAMPLTALFMFFFGGLVYLLVMRRTMSAPQVVQIFATVGMSVLLTNIALILWSADFRMLQDPIVSKTVSIGEIQVGITLLIAFIVAIMVSAFLFLFLAYTHMGRAIRATVQDRKAAQLMGIDIGKIFWLTFAVGSCIVGIAGALLAPIFPVFPTVGISFGVISFVVVVLGGMGSMPGALLGGLIIGLVETISGYFIDVGLKQAIYFIVFILVLMFRPNGFFGQKGDEE